MFHVEHLPNYCDCGGLGGWGPRRRERPIPPPGVFVKRKVNRLTSTCRLGPNYRRIGAQHFFVPFSTRFFARKPTPCAHRYRSISNESIERSEERRVGKECR